MKGRERGIPPPDDGVLDGYRRYAAEILLPLLAELNGELTGVKTSRDDIEYIHQSRVASRRIRAALPFFKGCFEPKVYRFWIRQIRDITRSLGPARDLDVQIAFLTMFIETHTVHDASIPLFTMAIQPAVHTEASLQELEFFTQPLLNNATQDPDDSDKLPDKIQGWLRKRKQTSMQQQESVPDICLQTLSLLKYPQAYNRPGLECLLLRLQQQREAMQPDVVDAVFAFEQKKALPMMQHYLLSHLTKHQDTPYPDSIYTDATSSILYLIQELCWYAPALADPRKKNMHHEMRIAAKRLRYTLEACTKLYDNSLSYEVKTVKALQTLLGDLHDCDVWIDLLPQFLDNEKERSQSYFGNTRFFSLISPGILFLLDNRIKEREQIHLKLVEYWEKLVHDEFFTALTEKARRSSNEIKQDKIHLETKQTQDISTKEDTGEKREELEKDVYQPVSTASMQHDDTVIALIGDVHANLPALIAVLADAKKRGATMILNAGDLVGYGPHPEEVIETLSSNGVISIIGNYDRSLLTQWWLSEEREALAYDQDWDTDREDTFMLRLKRETSKWTYENLSSDSREYLANLPEMMRKTLYGKNALFVHGSPSSITEYITAETPRTRLSEIAAASNADIIVSGHAHMPCVREVDQVVFINTGSVGRSEDGDPRACYALLSCGDENNLVVEHIRVSYDINETISKMEQCDFPERYIRAIREGRSPDLLVDNDTQDHENDAEH